MNNNNNLKPKPPVKPKSKRKSRNKSDSQKLRFVQHVVPSPSGIRVTEPLLSPKKTPKGDKPGDRNNYVVPKFDVEQDESSGGDGDDNNNDNGSNKNNNN